MKNTIKNNWNILRMNHYFPYATAQFFLLKLLGRVHSSNKGKEGWILPRTWTRRLCSFGFGLRWDRSMFGRSTHTRMDWSGVIQGDQIGRIFAYWVIDYCGQCFENYRNNAEFWAPLFHGTSCILILGDFFTNSSGHPGVIVRLHMVITFETIFKDIF
jgi:hypothetical protein